MKIFCILTNNISTSHCLHNVWISVYSIRYGFCGELTASSGPPRRHFTSHPTTPQTKEGSYTHLSLTDQTTGGKNGSIISPSQVRKWLRSTLRPTWGHCIFSAPKRLCRMREHCGVCQICWSKASLHWDGRVWKTRFEPYKHMKGDMSMKGWWQAMLRSVWTYAICIVVYIVV